jgi:hypothetical protein
MALSSEKLYEALKLMVDLDQKLGLQTSLAQIRDTLNQLVNSPAAPQHQNTLASAISTFSAGAERLPQEIGATQWSAIEELGGAEFFEPSIAEKVRGAIERNAMTPSVARDTIQDITTRRAEFLQTVSSTLEGITNLVSAGETRKKVPPAEAAFAIPRELFDNRVGLFAVELKFINQLVEHLSEAVTGEVQPVQLEGLSSSNPTVAIVAGLGVLKLLGSVINSFLEAWQKVQRIRGLREELKDVGITTGAVEELTERIETTVEEVVEESTRLNLIDYNKDGGRRNELDSFLKHDLRRLFGQIERGLTVEIRTHSESAEPSDLEELKAIAEIGRNLRFAGVAKEPMLLEAGEVLEGEISRVKSATKRSTSTTTTRRIRPAQSTVSSE